MDVPGQNFPWLKCHPGSKAWGEMSLSNFDSFGLPMPEEVLAYMRTDGKQIIYSGDEIQERNSVLCGYWCLYYIRERQTGLPLMNVIHNEAFNVNEHHVNHNFLINYFKRL